MPSYKLVYFDGRGRGELCRILFVLAGQKFEDVRIPFQDWGKNKPTTLFGQLPILEIDSKPYAQSMALSTYLAKEFGYYGKSNLEQLQIDQVLCLVADFYNEVTKFFLEKDEAKKAELMKTFAEVVTPKYLTFFENLLKKNGTGYFVGNSVTLADLSVYDFVYGVKVKTPPGLLNNYPLIAALFDRVENLDRLKGYLANRKVTEF